ncbi:MAG: cytochrome b [Burkholderiaceae bacterium]
MSVDPPGRYDVVAIALHWLVAALVLIGFAMGLLMVDLSLSPRQLQVVSWHKSIGVTVFFLAWIRIAWRLCRPAPALLPMPPWQRRAARLGHFGLYVLLVAIPLSGWLYSSASGVPTVWLGLVPLPDLVAPDGALEETLVQAHLWLNWSLAALVMIHVAAALKHHLVDRDATLLRMLPNRRRQQ